ncbi:hypothetical protein [Janibacter melonis]|uniref:hypothetical protein n=1 Tax=Janibacter melonis TaxID=262209 RepID=UPI000A822DE2|nr:hypothetical protein [Janibacter melonis]
MTISPRVTQRYDDAGRRTPRRTVVTGYDEITASAVTAHLSLALAVLSLPAVSLGEDWPLRAREERIGEQVLRGIGASPLGFTRAQVASQQLLVGPRTGRVAAHAGRPAPRSRRSCPEESGPASGGASC